ncbi:MAG: hypothetical protein B5M53_08820 [Candidatus Cloacimonas sp. 4484_209]|nr:MAG: hypothetical protein B5M53_08820 [Candidatus Cloacimonas sp. 4484_209]
MTICYIHTMNQKDKILEFLKRNKSVSGHELSRFLSISRQALNKHLKVLIQKGLVVKNGKTRNAAYSLAGKIKPEKRLKKQCILEGLEEHKVFNEVALQLNFRKNLSNNVLHIVNYVFSEILNNAIEHSKSENCNIEIVLDQYNCNFIIRDYGIGIFYSIYKKFDLSDEISAIGELIKGRTTTMKEKHSGEGVFFSSKSGDIVTFRSHKITLTFDNRKKDIFIEEKRHINGTEVKFSISRASKRNLENIFKQYAPEAYNYRFEKTKVFVNLFQTEFVSRSEAKRLLFGLEKFKEIVLDFKGVKLIGQGFADEIFRVFKKEHPNIIIKTENLNPVITFMIKHVVDNKN